MLGGTWCIRTDSKHIPIWFRRRRQAVLVDSGDPGTEREELEALLNQEGLGVSAILTTHAHLDHTGNHAWFQNRYGARLFVPLYSAGVLSAPTCLSACFEASTLRETMTFAQPMLCRADRLVLPGQTQVTAGGGSFRVVPLPGHSPDHTGYVTPDGVACLGDLLLSGRILAGARLPYSFCWQADLDSRQVALEIPCTVSILAHGGVCTDLTALVAENEAVFCQAVKRVLSLVGEGCCHDQLLGRVVRALSLRMESPFYRDATERSVRALADYLQDTGALIATKQDGVPYLTVAIT